MGEKELLQLSLDGKYNYLICKDLFNVLTKILFNSYRPNFAGPSATPAVAPTVISTSAPTPETLSPTDKAPTPSSNPNPNPIVNNNTNANVSNSNAASSNSSESSAAIPKKTANEVDSKKRKLTLKSPDNAKKKKISEQPETPPPSPSAKVNFIPFFFTFI